MTNTLDKLNSFLRGELSAVETYQQALDKLAGKPEAAMLNDCMRSHARRAELLTAEIRRRGGEPAHGSGPWGAFAKLVEGGAKVFGEKAAVAALEEGEDHGRDGYKRDTKELEVDAQEWVNRELWPEQLRTHQVMSKLKKSLH